MLLYARVCLWNAATETDYLKRPNWAQTVRLIITLHRSLDRSIANGDSVCPSVIRVNSWTTSKRFNPNTFIMPCGPRDTKFVINSLAKDTLTQLLYVSCDEGPSVQQMIQHAEVVLNTTLQSASVLKYYIISFCTVSIHCEGWRLAS